jgi:hypothetical protein
VDQSVSGCTAFNLSKPNKIAAFEIAITVLEFPQWRLWRTRMEDIADWATLATDLQVTVAGDTNLCGIRTYSIVVRMTKYLCA